MGKGPVALIEKLQDENQQLTGRVGFLQAQRQLLEERVRPLEAPEDEGAPPPETQDGAAPQGAARRRWWQRLVWG